MSKGLSGLFSGTKGAKNAIPGEAVFKSPKYEFFENVSKRKDIDPGGKFDIVLHGAPNHVKMEVNGRSFSCSPRNLARIIMHNPEYKKGQPIRLLSCYTGSMTNGFAQNLANKLNAVVYAPSDIVWAYPDGRIIVASALKGSPVLLPDLTRIGKFIPFYPGGNRE